jgi:hypothetical protein
MGSVTLAGTFEYIENDGTVVTEALDIDDTFESTVKLDITEAGMATYAVPFGTVVTAKAVLIRMLTGDATVWFNGVADGPTILAGGCQAFILGECTSIDLDHAVEIHAEVTILGDLT